MVNTGVLKGACGQFQLPDFCILGKPGFFLQLLVPINYSYKALTPYQT